MGRSAEGEIKMPQASVTLAGIRSQQDEKQPGVTKQRGGWPCRIQAFEGYATAILYASTPEES